MYRTSFFPQTIRLWNQLPGSVVEADTLDSLKAQLSDVTPNPKVQEYLIGYALYLAKEEEEELT